MLWYLAYLVGISLMTLVSLAAAIWIAMTAPRHRLSRWWAVPILLLWYVFLPIYLIKRYQLRRATKTLALVAVAVIVAIAVAHRPMNRVELARNKGEVYTIDASNWAPKYYGEIPPWDLWVMDGVRIVVPSDQILSKGSASVFVASGSTKYSAGGFAWRLLRWGLVHGDRRTPLRRLLYEADMPDSVVPYLPDPFNPTAFALCLWLLTVAAGAGIVLGPVGSTQPTCAAANTADQT